MAEPKLTPSALRALAKLKELLEGEGFEGEIRIVVHEGGVRTVTVTKQVKC